LWARNIKLIGADTPFSKKQKTNIPPKAARGERKKQNDAGGIVEDRVRGSSMVSD